MHKEKEGDKQDEAESLEPIRSLFKHQASRACQAKATRSKVDLHRHRHHRNHTIQYKPNKETRGNLNRSTSLKEEEGILKRPKKGIRKNSSFSHGLLFFNERSRERGNPWTKLFFWCESSCCYSDVTEKPSKPKHRGGGYLTQTVGVKGCVVKLMALTQRRDPASPSAVWYTIMPRYATPYRIVPCHARVTVEHNKRRVTARI